jgi:thiamine-monophosphate kinase
MDEFDLIRKLFAPLARSEGAVGLDDDVAELKTEGRTIVTVDAIVEGVHFLGGDPIETVAHKLVAVNASDIIAKGGRPSEAVLTLVWPKARPATEIERFATGLGKALAQWKCALIGGDTTSTEGPLVLSLTMTGACGARGPARRSGAKAGDDLWVTGVIGEAHAGLLVLTGKLPGLGAEDETRLVAAYRTPQPPSLEMADLIADVATGAIDVSDGLIADAGHVARASGVDIEIDAARVPLGPVVGRVLNPDAALTGGDDYQSLFTAPPAAAAKIAGHATRIGRVVKGDGRVRLIGPDGAERALPRAGWRHDLG